MLCLCQENWKCPLLIRHVTPHQEQYELNQLRAKITKYHKLHNKHWIKGFYVFAAFPIQSRPFITKPILRPLIRWKRRGWRDAAGMILACATCLCRWLSLYSARCLPRPLCLSLLLHPPHHSAWLAFSPPLHLSVYSSYHPSINASFTKLAGWVFGARLAALSEECSPQMSWCLKTSALLVPLSSPFLTQCSVKMCKLWLR